MLPQAPLDQCPLFQGLEPEARDYALAYFDAMEKSYAKGAFLHQVATSLPRFGLVLAGTVEVCMDDIDGHHHIMNNVGPGCLFGEAYCFLGLEAPIYIQAVTQTDILWMSPDRVRTPQPPFRPLDWELSNRFISALAARTLAINQRVQILSRSTLRAKIIAFLSQYATDQGDSFTIPFDRAGMASFLGADRSALSRELSKLRQEGVLDYHRNHFHIAKGPLNPPEDRGPKNSGGRA